MHKESPPTLKTTALLCCFSLKFSSKQPHSLLKICLFSTCFSMPFYSFVPFIPVCPALHKGRPELLVFSQFFLQFFKNNTSNVLVWAFRNYKSWNNTIIRKTLNYGVPVWNSCMTQQPIRSWYIWANFKQKTSA